MTFYAHSQIELNAIVNKYTSLGFDVVVTELLSGTGALDSIWCVDVYCSAVA